MLSSDGYVLTNTHVVTLDGASADGTIEVTTYDGKLYKAKIVGIDPIVDLAVIKLEDASGLQPIEFADSSDLNVGDQAVAIGAPLGLANTVTDGIVSALNRSIQIASSAVPDDTSEQDSDGGRTTTATPARSTSGTSGRTPAPPRPSPPPSRSPSCRPTPPSTPATPVVRSSTRRVS